MAYIGRQPTVGNFRICDAISVVNGQAAYTMQVGGVNVIPESANNMIVSLNGVIQKPGSSYTVSSSTITFSSNLSTGDVIDFIQILGGVANIGTPSDGTVSLAKLSATGTKSSSTFLRGDNTFASAGGTNSPRFLARKTSDQSISNGTATKVTFDDEHYDTGVFDLSTNRFTVPSGEAGIYMIYAGVNNNFANASVGQYIVSDLRLNGTRIVFTSSDWRNNYGGYANTLTMSVALNLSVSDYIEVFTDIGVTSGTPAVKGHGSEYKTWIGGYKLIT